MSSNESSGAPAEATATPPASIAAFPSSGSTRGSGLARGKRPSSGPASTPAASNSEYTPTAIEVVTAPREYQNPFAPANPEPAAPVATPAAVAPAPAVAHVAVHPEPAAHPEPSPAPAEPTATMTDEEPAELNILPPEQPKVTPAQTWESEGFRPGREARNDRPRREERQERAPREERAAREERAPFDPSTIPEKFLYVRPGYNYVPTPSNYGGAPRERDSAPAAAPTPYASSAPAAEAPAKSGGFLGWLKSLFGGSPAAAPAAPAASGEMSHDGQRQPGRNRGGRGRGPGGGDGHRRHRGGRGRGQRGGEYRSGGDHGGPAAT
jgi:translation initiation factor IF-2